MCSSAMLNFCTSLIQSQACCYHTQPWCYLIIYCYEVATLKSASRKQSSSLIWDLVSVTLDFKKSMTEKLYPHERICQFRCICGHLHEDMVAVAPASFSNLQSRNVPLGRLRMRPAVGRTNGKSSQQWRTSISYQRSEVVAKITICLDRPKRQGPLKSADGAEYSFKSENNWKPKNWAMPKGSCWWKLSHTTVIAFLIPINALEKL